MEEDVEGYINTCFEEANGALANSLVPMRLRHHGTRVYEDREKYDGGQMLAAFTSMVPGDNTAVLKSADTGFLLTSKSNVCGVGYLNSVSAPFAMATHDCAR